MAGFGTVEKNMVASSKFATLMGKYYERIFVVFRLFLTLSMAKGSTSDTVGDIECDTNTIGCPEMCHNYFFPFALARYWQLQVFCVGLPTIMFMAYKTKVDISVAAFLKEQERNREKNGTEESDLEKIEREHAEGHTKFRSLQAHVPPKLFLWYYFTTWARMIIDIVFTFFQYRIYVFKFLMPAKFYCEEYPCRGGLSDMDNNIYTTCFIADHIQRSIYINIHFFFVCVTILLSLLDIYSIGTEPVLEAWYNRSYNPIKKNKGPVFFEPSGKNADGFVDIRNLPRQPSNRNAGGFVQSSGITYRTSVMPRTQSVLRSRSRAY